MVGTLVVLGIVTLVGVSGAIWSSCTESDRAQAEIDRLRSENLAINKALEDLYDVQSKLESAINYLTNSKNDFTSGGWVNNGIPLANNEFGYSMTKVNSALTNCTNLINGLTATVNANNTKINQLSLKVPKKSDE